MSKTTDVIVSQGASLKQSDSAPNLQAQLIEDSSGGSLTVGNSTQRNPVDLNNATVTLSMADSDGNIVIDKNSVTVTDADNGRVEYDWDSSDTSTAGDYTAEFEVTFTNTNETVTYPNDSEFDVKVYEELN